VPRDDDEVTAPSEPRAVIDALNATINAHDSQAGRILYRDNARLVTATGRVLDPDGLARMLDHTLAAFPDLRMTVLRWVVEGDTVVTEELMEGTHEGEFGGLAPTHVRVRLPMVHLTRVRDGRIVERVAYHDTAGILRQLEPAVTF
jgi:predicted ester cyclase